MAVRLRGLEHLAAIVAIVFVAVAIGVAVYALSLHAAGQTKGSASGYEKSTRCYARIVAVKPRIGWLDVHVYTTCRTVVDTVYFIDPVTRDLLVPVQLLYPVELEPYKVSIIRVPLLNLEVNISRLDRPVALALGTTSGWNLVTANWFNPYMAMKRALENAWLIMLADRYSWTGIYTYDWPYTHWVFFNFITGQYYFYSYPGVARNPAEGPYAGHAPILRNTDKYLLTCDWVPWSQRPVDSPVVIVYNPTRGLKTWRFTWIEPHGYDVFVLPPVARKPSEVIYDFLVFWEDLWNPFRPPSQVDDWKDHVVRVTLYANGTVRLQVYIAKGGYLHVFRHQTSLANADTLGYSLCPGSTHCYGFCRTGPTSAYDYCKPHGAFWSNRVADGYVFIPQCGEDKQVYYYYPMPDKLWYVQLQG